METLHNKRAISFPIVVSGPSGVGKTTLCHHLMSRVGGLAFSISATTRPPRPTEEHGKDYFFISREEFERMRNQGEFAEWAVVHGELYGTPKRWLDEKLNQGISVLLDIDVQGGTQIMKAYPDGVFIFIVPPSMDELVERLRKRKSETDEAIARRLENARREMEYVDKYAYIVVNDVIDKAVSTMACILEAERCKRERVLKGITWKELVNIRD